MARPPARLARNGCGTCELPPTLSSRSVRVTSEQCMIVNFAELLGRIRWGKMADDCPKSSTKIPK